MAFRPASLIVPLSCALIALTACSKNDSGGSQPGATGSDVRSGPDIAPSAAPGVAFNYAYEFSLPDNGIAAAQEAHAAACEKLGLARCRITGMSYRVDQERDVTAELDLKLDPAIARAFGKASEHSVEGGGGRLINMEIGSTDEGSAIAAAGRQRADAENAVHRLDREIAAAPAGSTARASLVQQREALEAQAAEQSRAISSSQVTLASTPMTFRYYGEGGIPGFRGNPMREASSTFVATVVSLVGWLLQLIAVLLPVGVLVALLVFLWRSRPVRAIRRWVFPPREYDDAAGAETGHA